MPPPKPDEEISESRNGKPPQLAPGVELIGRYQDSGFKEQPFIARRSDGQVVQLPELLFVLAEEVDGKRSYEQVAERVSEKFGRGLSGENVQMLVDEKLFPLGLAVGPQGEEPQAQKLDPLLALKFRARVVPETVVNTLTRVFRFLFFPPVIVAVLAGLVAVDVWLFAYHGVAQSARQVLYDPALLLVLLGLVIASAAFHETGHATACAYGGARPGVMGAGLYIVWPAFYTDVTDAYRLDKRGRLRTDLGGVYFNVVFILGTAAAYLVTGFEPLLLFIPIMHFEIVHQFLPFLRMDGYYIVSDMTGVPDMFARIKPTLKSLLPWRKADDRVTVLKPWVRVAVTIYVLTVIPALLFMFGLMLINAPRIFATAYDSFWVQKDKVSAAASGDDWLSASVGGIQMAVLILPIAGMVVTFLRTGWKGWRGTTERPAARAALVVGVACLTAAMGYIWWPNGDYRPIQRGERGTIQGAVRQFGAIATGRPGLTKQRERQLGGAPTRRSQERRAPGQAPPQQTGTQTTPTSTTGTETSTTGTETTPTSTSGTETTPTTTTDTTPTPTDTTTSP